jgi:excisionase family DNA binding protein
MSAGDVPTRTTGAPRHRRAQDGDPLDDGADDQSQFRTLASDELPLALSVAEAAHLVGVSTRTMYRAVRAGTVPTVQLVPGGQLFVPRVALQQWLSTLSSPPRR